jgi:hypothetical protein
VIRFLASCSAYGRRLVISVVVGTALLFAASPVAALAKDGRGEVRAVGVCGNGAVSELRLRSRDGGIDVRFELDSGRTNVAWRVVVVHERRVAWKGVARTTRPNGSFEVRRTLRDLPGDDAVTASAWGPRGLICRATATLSDS